jgi:hypothetical protein
VRSAWKSTGRPAAPGLRPGARGGGQRRQRAAHAGPTAGARRAVWPGNPERARGARHRPCCRSAALFIGRPQSTVGSSPAPPSRSRLFSAVRSALPAIDQRWHPSTARAPPARGLMGGAAIEQPRVASPTPPADRRVRWTACRR